MFIKKKSCKFKQQKSLAQRDSNIESKQNSRIE